jgi:Aspartyl/Asparaginyl beta-hydroxylase
MTDLTSNSSPFRPGAAVRLPLTFAVAPLVAELSALTTAAWKTHFNTGYHDGGGHADSLYIPRDANDAGAAARDILPTQWAALCPNLMASLAAWPCRIESARVLRLAPGAVIREHRDDDLLWSQGLARLHVPLLTHDRVEFYVDQQRVVMAAGECWYLDLSRPHRVQNRSLIERVHLVLDCVINDWLADQVKRGVAVPGALPATSPENGASQFARFRELIFADAALQQRMRLPPTLDALMAQAVTEGADHGFQFSIEDVRAHCNQAHRDWIEQWIM